MIKKILSNLPIYIHSWGGLGSQLFALAFILQLRHKKFARKIVLIHHTGGVTYRYLDSSIFGYFGIPFKVVDDYQPRSLSTKSSQIQLLRRLVRSVASFLLASSRFLLISKKSRLHVMPWTMIVRHHYFRERLSPEILRQIAVYYQQPSSAITDLVFADEGTVLIHQRLGDLQWLPEKDPVSMKRIVRVICSLSDERDLKLLISSDSPDTALFQLGCTLLAYNDCRHMMDTFKGTLEEFLSAGISAHTFIGTNSKISIWIALFRVQIGRKNTFLPKEIRDDFIFISPFISAVEFY